MVKDVILAVICTMKTVAVYSPLAFAHCQTVAHCQVTANLDCPPPVILIRYGLSVVVYSVEDDVNMRMLAVIMTDYHQLCIDNSHSAEIQVCYLQHLLIIQLCCVVW